MVFALEREIKVQQTCVPKGEAQRQGGQSGGRHGPQDWDSEWTLGSAAARGAYTCLNMHASFTLLNLFQ